MSQETEEKTGSDETMSKKAASAARKAAGTTGEETASFAAPYAEIEAFNANAFDAYLRASRAVLESAAALNQEMMRFAGERVKADLEALQVLPGYTNVQGMVSFQSEYMRKLAEAYQTEFTKLMQQSTDAASAMFEPLLESVRESAGEGSRK